MRFCVDAQTSVCISAPSLPSGTDPLALVAPTSTHWLLAALGEECAQGAKAVSPRPRACLHSHWTCFIIVCTINMDIEFSVAKDKRNRIKHGLSLRLAAKLDWDAMLARVDDRKDYGEERWIGIAPHDGRLYTVVFTIEDNEHARVINLRRATSREIESYESQGRK